MAYREPIIVNQRGAFMDKEQFYEEMRKIENHNKKYEKERQKKIRKTLRWAKRKMFILNLTKGD